MSSVISNSILGLTAAAVVAGFLLGAFRGRNRSILRFITVIACAVCAFIGKDKVLDALIKTPIQGKTIDQIIAEALPEGFAPLVNALLPLLEALLGVILFVVLFLTLQFVSWVLVYQILKIFVRVEKRDGKKKKQRLFGAILGLIQGAGVAYLLCVPLNGLMVEVNKLASIDLSAMSTVVGEENAAVIDSLDQYTEPIKTYVDSDVSKTYTKIGGVAFEKVSTIKTDKGDITLSKQMNTLTGIVQTLSDMAGQIQNITNLKFDDGLTLESVQDVKELFANLEEIKNNMNPEVKEAFNETVKGLASELGGDLPIDLEKVDLTEINFIAEGDLIETMYKFKDTGSTDEIDADELVNNLANSDLIFPAIMETGLVVNDLDADKKQEVTDAINSLPADTDPQKIEDLKKLFNITDPVV